jgi:hypothetical protein
MAGHQCTVCSSDAVEAIESMLVAGVPYRRIAATHGISTSALSRHRKDHLSAAIVALASGTGSETAGGTGPERGTLVSQLHGLLARARAILDAAECSGKPATALQAIKESRAILETVARVTGELDTRPQVTVNVLGSPEWIEVQRVILAALSPYPDARWAVAAALDVDDQARELLP